MEKILTVKVQDEKSAYEVMSKIKHLDNENEISLKEIFVLEKTQEGKIEVKDAEGKVPATFYDTLIGSLMGGLIAGPVGVLVGGLTGILVGEVTDLNDLYLDDKVETLIEDKMSNGDIMVISHLYEDWDAPLNTEIGNYGEVQRISIDEEIEKKWKEKKEEYEKKIQEIKEKIKTATAEEKAKLQKELDEIKEKRDKFNTKIHNKLHEQKEEYKAWITKLKNKKKK